MDANEPISPSEFLAADGLGDWRVLGDGAHAHYRTGTLAESARFIAAIAELAGIDESRPAVDIRAGGVTIRIMTVTPEFGGMTRGDAELARRISEAARHLGLTADPTAAQGFLVVPGAPDIASVMPFWKAILGYEPRADSPEEDLVDPHERNPAFWFETMDEPRGDGGGAIHVAVWVPIEAAQARVDAALAAGGRIVRDDRAPAWWTLADAAGNEADVATVASRD